eukprot:652564-Pyramimonas_sp.AAC.1
MSAWSPSGYGSWWARMFVTKRSRCYALTGRARLCITPLDEVGRVGGEPELVARLRQLVGPRPPRLPPGPEEASLMEAERIALTALAEAKAAVAKAKAEEEEEREEGENEGMDVDDDERGVGSLGAYLKGEARIKVRA